MRAAASALGALAVAATLLGGCGELRPSPYNGRLSCDGVGGRYTAAGRCVGGSGASLVSGAGAGGADPAHGPDLDRDVTQGIQSRSLDHTLGR